MKKFLVMIFLVTATPAFAWWDSYGGFTCGYMDPLTSILDSIFGPPCPPPRPVAVAAPAPVAVVEQPVPVPVVPNGRPRPSPPGVIPPVGPAYFPGFIVGPAPWQPLMPMW